MKRSLLAMGLLVLLAGVVHADFRVNPEPPKAALVIELNENFGEPQLIVPRKFLAPGNQKGASLPGMSTIVAGLALTLAFATGGLWLARHRRGPAGSAWLVAGLALLGLGVGLACADRGPRPQPKPLAEFGRVHVVVVERGEQIKLVINKEQLAKLTEAKK